VSPGESKVVGDIGEALEKVGIRDGMTLSFHHHLRNGDGVINAVIHTASELGVKDLKATLRSVSPVHAPMVEHFESGVGTALDTDYHSDAAAGAKLTIVVASLVRGNLPIVTDEVLTATTPGESVDVVVTDPTKPPAHRDPQWSATRSWR
jgi:citrate lyase alpha subunit